MKHLAALAVAAASLAACGGKKKSPPADPTVAETCKVENDQKEVELSGFLYAPSLADPCDRLCVVEVQDKRDELDINMMQIYFPVGTGPMSMKALQPKGTAMIEQISLDAFTVIDSDGKPRRIGDRVRLKGVVSVKKDKAPDGDGKTIDVTVCTMTPKEIHGV